MMKMNKGAKKLLMLVSIAVLVYLLFNMNGKSAYTLTERDFMEIGGEASVGPGPSPKREEPVVSGGCQMNAGTGLASSLLPREVAQGEFGEFSPEDLLKGQNFLEPRQQIGFPETIGGALRNANQQIRADPPNPKQPYVWNNSTIVPDTMQRDLC
ncbi:hypothetical protein [Dishui Lake phycodnavirus 2]|nr:hypothetical protein [Dishui Lake phycodnavirus 2]